MKKSFVLLFAIGFMHIVSAQKLSLKLDSESDNFKVGDNVWYCLVLTNDTKKSIKLFRTIMADYKVGGYEYSVTLNGNKIISEETSYDDCHEKFSEKGIIELAPGANQPLLGLKKFKIKEPGKYEIHVTYFQNPSNVNAAYAKNKTALKLAKKITPFKIEITKKFNVE